jgi:hypothetical protein
VHTFLRLVNKNEEAHCFDLDMTLIDTSLHYKACKDILDFLNASSGLSKEKFWSQKRQGEKTVDFLPISCPKEFVQEFMTDWLKRVENREYIEFDYLSQNSECAV